MCNLHCGGDRLEAGDAASFLVEMWVCRGWDRLSCIETLLIQGPTVDGDRALRGLSISDQVVTSADSKKHIQINEYNIIVWVVIPYVFCNHIT